MINDDRKNKLREFENPAIFESEDKNKMMKAQLDSLCR